ncbi:solute carrier family 15 member 5 [Rhincodon typus]|uniref:solute carrier family 15 member 5 n=1 Tax=Rhincodon typus TaxID=259920 RepID=UPI002030153C|nr:solute carrier family 15 member 5 [Rhincodon typus]
MSVLGLKNMPETIGFNPTKRRSGKVRSFNREQNAGARYSRKKLQIVICLLSMELCERFTYFGIVCNMILYCTLKLGYKNYQAAIINLCFVGASTLTPVLVGWFAESCMGRTKVVYICALLHFIGTMMLPVVAFPFEDFYIDTHHNIDALDKGEQTVLFFIGLLSASLGSGGIRAVVCPFSAYRLQEYDQSQLLTFFNWFHWFVNLNSAVVFVGIAYIQQSIAKNLGFLIPFASILMTLLTIHMVQNRLIYQPKSVIGHLCAVLSVVVAGISEMSRRNFLQVEQTLSGKVLLVSSMPCFHLAPQYLLLGISEALVTPACKLITFRLSPKSIRGIAMQFMTLFNSAGCFVGAMIIQTTHQVSGGNWFPNNLNVGNLDTFFFLLAAFMLLNILGLWRISHRYRDLQQENDQYVKGVLLEKLMEHEKSLKFYDSVVDWPTFSYPREIIL